MTTHTRIAHFITAALLTCHAIGQDDGRAFGQLQPGQSVVEIGQDEPPADALWQPVDVGTRLQEAARAEPSPNVPPPGGFVSLEELAARQAEADAASRRHARDLAESLRTVTDAGRDIEASQPLARPEPASRDGLAPKNTSTYAEASRSDSGRLPVAREAALASAALVPPTIYTPGENRPLRTDTGLTGDASESGQATSGNRVMAWFDSQGAAVQTMLALGMVILLIYALAWAYRKMTANQVGVADINSGKAPAGILEVLGRYPLGGKQSLVLLKFDQRVLLLSQSSTGKGGSEMTTLCELDRPEDVASVLVKIRDAEGTSINKTFRAAMHKAELQGQVAVRTPAPAAQALEAKPGPARKPDVLPGHNDPFAGRGGQPIGGGRPSTPPETDRAELWTDDNANDPVAALRKRLDALRNAQAKGQPCVRRSSAGSTSTQEWIT